MSEPVDIFVQCIAFLKKYGWHGDDSGLWARPGTTDFTWDTEHAVAEQHAVLRSKNPTPFPGPDSTHAEIEGWYRENVPRFGVHPQQEAAPMENGPSPMCNACGKVRVAWVGGMPVPFCETCNAQIGGGQ